MKIYKSNLQQFLQEAKPPFYLSHSRIQMPSPVQNNPVHADIVQLSGKNETGDWCELHLQTPTAFDFDKDGSKKMSEAAEGWTTEIRLRLEALNLELRNGRVANEPMIGVLE